MQVPEDDQNGLLEFIYSDTLPDTADERIQLIRILSRSSTLPKVENIFINVLSSDPKGFFIDPGKSISIGSDYLTKPVAALLCMRYGLEWQIWYKNQPADIRDCRICDIAACRVAAKFHELTPDIDKDSIDHIPKVMSENILKCKENDDVSFILNRIDLEALKPFHNQEYTQKRLNKDHVEILNHLASPVEYLMMSGGDLRLKVDSDRLLNKYGCRPFPRPGAFTFASSTASSISNRAYNKAQFKRKRLIKNSFKQGLFKTFAEFSEKIKSDLKEYLNIPDTAKILLASSGTDISLQIAGICQALFKKQVAHILVASDETGSGVPAALQGRHFSNTTSQRVSVEKGKLIEGIRDVDLINIKLRDTKGQLKNTEDVDDEVFQVIKKIFDSGKQPVLHVMDQSKLGYSAPGDGCLENLKQKFGDELLVNIDNSQLRMDPVDIHRYMEQGYMMTLTGSKFFTGPPFNGALLIPENLSKNWETENLHLPKGLVDYSYKNEWPNWPLVKDLRKGINEGVNMRWYASLVEIRRYYNTPLSLRYLGIEMFCEHVKNTIDNTNFTEQITGYNKPPQEKHDPLGLKNRKTIFPFFIKDRKRVLTKNEVDKVYHLLNRDLSKAFTHKSDETQRLAGQACHIGQPVAAKYKDGTASGVLRINLGARVISESWKDRDSSLYFKGIKEQMIQVNLIIRKIELIIRNLKDLTESDYN